MTAKTLEQLVLDRIEAKREEDVAVARRRDIDKAILAHIPVKYEGTESVQAGGLKITATFGVNRTCDNDKLRTDWNGLPVEVQAAFRWKPEVAVAELKKLGDEHRVTALGYFTTKPASTSLDFKVQ